MVTSVNCIGRYNKLQLFTAHAIPSLGFCNPQGFYEKRRLEHPPFIDLIYERTHPDQKTMHRQEFNEFLAYPHYQIKTNAERDAKGNTALMILLEYGDPEEFPQMLQVLNQSSMLDLFAQNEAGVTAFHLLCIRGDLNTFKAILPYCPLEQMVDPEGLNLYHYCGMTHQAQSAALIQNHALELNISSQINQPSENPPFFYARDPKMLLWFLENDDFDYRVTEPQSLNSFAHHLIKLKQFNLLIDKNLIEKQRDIILFAKNAAGLSPVDFWLASFDWPHEGKILKKLNDFEVGFLKQLIAIFNQNQFKDLKHLQYGPEILFLGLKFKIMNPQEIIDGELLTHALEGFLYQRMMREQARFNYQWVLVALKDAINRYHLPIHSQTGAPEHLFQRLISAEHGAERIMGLSDAFTELSLKPFEEIHDTLLEQSLLLQQEILFQWLINKEHAPSIIASDIPSSHPKHRFLLLDQAISQALKTKNINFTKIIWTNLSNNKKITYLKSRLDQASVIDFLIHYDFLNQNLSANFLKSLQKLQAQENLTAYLAIKLSEIKKSKELAPEEPMMPIAASLLESKTEQELNFDDVLDWFQSKSAAHLDGILEKTEKCAEIYQFVLKSLTEEAKSSLLFAPLKYGKLMALLLFYPQFQEFAHLGDNQLLHLAIEHQMLDLALQLLKLNQVKEHLNPNILRAAIRHASGICNELCKFEQIKNTAADDANQSLRLALAAYQMDVSQNLLNLQSVYDHLKADQFKLLTDFASQNEASKNYLSSLLAQHPWYQDLLDGVSNHNEAILPLNESEQELSTPDLDDAEEDDEDEDDLASLNEELTGPEESSPATTPPVQSDETEDPLPKAHRLRRILPYRKRQILAEHLNQSFLCAAQCGDFRFFSSLWWHGINQRIVFFKNIRALALCLAQQGLGDLLIHLLILDKSSCQFLNHSPAFYNELMLTAFLGHHLKLVHQLIDFRTDRTDYLAWFNNRFLSYIMSSIDAISSFHNQNISFNPEIQAQIAERLELIHRLLDNPFVLAKAHYSANHLTRWACTHQYSGVLERALRAPKVKAQLGIFNFDCLHRAKVSGFEPIIHQLFHVPEVLAYACHLGPVFYPEICTFDQYLNECMRLFLSVEQNHLKGILIHYFNTIQMQQPLSMGTHPMTLFAVPVYQANALPVQMAPLAQWTNI